MTVDVHEIRVFARDLRMAGLKALAEGEKVVAKGSLNIKTRARQLIGHTPHLPYYAESISYDVYVRGETIDGEIGPVEGRRQRGLGNLLEYGGPHNRPHPHHEPALDEETPRFYKACEDLAARLTEGQ